MTAGPSAASVATVPRRRPSTLALGGLGVALATAGLWLAVGPLGIGVGLVVGVAWLLVPAPYAVAVAQVLAVAVLPVGRGTAGVTRFAGAPLPVLLAVELGLLAVLAAPLLETASPGRSLLALVVAAVGLVGSLAMALRWGAPLWLAAVVLALVAATVAYGLHRVERVRLGAVT